MAVASKKATHGVSRRLPTGDRRTGLRRHTKLLGEVVWAWSQLHLAFAFAFIQLYEVRGTLLGQAIWVGLRNDSSQRDILENALPVSIATKVQQRALLWALGEAGRLSGYRNDIVHGPMGWRLTMDGTVPTFSYLGNPLARLMRYMGREDEDGELLAGPDLRRLMMLLRGDARQLEEYVLEVSRSIGEEKRQPLPRKPRLQAHEYVLTAQGKKKPRKRAKARHTRPRSFPR